MSRCWARWAGRLPSLSAADLVFAGLLVLVATGRVFSPQFFVWIAGIGAVALLDRRTVMRIPVLLVVGSAVIAQYVYPLRTGWPLEGDALAMQVIRVALVIGALVWSIRAVLRAWQPQRHRR